MSAFARSALLFGMGSAPNDNPARQNTSKKNAQQGVARFKFGTRPNNRADGSRCRQMPQAMRAPPSNHGPLRRASRTLKQPKQISTTGDAGVIRATGEAQRFPPSTVSQVSTEPSSEADSSLNTMSQLTMSQFSNDFFNVSSHSPPCSEGTVCDPLAEDSQDEIAMHKFHPTTEGYEDHFNDKGHHYHDVNDETISNFSRRQSLLPVPPIVPAFQQDMTSPKSNRIVEAGNSMSARKRFAEPARRVEGRTNLGIPSSNPSTKLWMNACFDVLTPFRNSLLPFNRKQSPRPPITNHHLSKKSQMVPINSAEQVASYFPSKDIEGNDGHVSRRDQRVPLSTSTMEATILNQSGELPEGRHSPSKNPDSLNDKQDTENSAGGGQSLNITKSSKLPAIEEKLKAEVAIIADPVDEQANEKCVPSAKQACNGESELKSNVQSHNLTPLNSSPPTKKPRLSIGEQQDQLLERMKPCIEQMVAKLVDEHLRGAKTELRQRNRICNSSASDGHMVDEENVAPTRSDHFDSAIEGSSTSRDNPMDLRNSPHSKELSALSLKDEDQNAKAIPEQPLRTPRSPPSNKIEDQSAKDQVRTPRCMGKEKSEKTRGRPPTMSRRNARPSLISSTVSCAYKRFLSFQKSVSSEKKSSPIGSTEAREDKRRLDTLILDSDTSIELKRGLSKAPETSFFSSRRTRAGHASESSPVAKKRIFPQEKKRRSKRLKKTQKTCTSAPTKLCSVPATRTPQRSSKEMTRLEVEKKDDKIEKNSVSLDGEVQEIKMPVKRQEWLLGDVGDEDGDLKSVAVPTLSDASSSLDAFRDGSVSKPNNVAGSIERLKLNRKADSDPKQQSAAKSRDLVIDGGFSEEGNFRYGSLPSSQLKKRVRACTRKNVLRGDFVTPVQTPELPTSSRPTYGRQRKPTNDEYIDDGRFDFL